MPSVRFRKPQSPLIAASGWGQVQAEGCEKPFRDAMLFPGGGREWDWNASVTSHHAGIQVADVEALLARDVSEVVLSTGRLGLLRVPREVLDLLAARGVKVHVLRTGAAIDRYNALASVPDGPRVGALIHSTC